MIGMLARKEAKPIHRSKGKRRDPSGKRNQQIICDKVGVLERAKQLCKPTLHAATADLFFYWAITDNP
jgi:hypothetical protein